MPRDNGKPQEEILDVMRKTQEEQEAQARKLEEKRREN